MKKPLVVFAVASSLVLAGPACSAAPAGPGPAPASNQSSTTGSAHLALPSPVNAQLRAQPRTAQEQQLPSTGDTAADMASFLAMVMTGVDRYWTKVWQEAGYPEPYVNVFYPGPGEKMVDPCNGYNLTTDQDAFYCSINDTIVISQVMATEMLNGQVGYSTGPGTKNLSGDFSVALVVAHEYAHNLQAELGILPTAPEARTYPVYKTELHADCWAGVWANSAYYEGVLEAGDIEEGIQAAMSAGDYDFNNPAHHGTPEQRAAAFMAGYNSGVPLGCDPWLTDSY